MPPPTPLVLIHQASSPSHLVVKRLGLLTESGSEPILLDSVQAVASLQTDQLEDVFGDLYAEAWGNRSLEYEVRLKQLAQYGLSDSYLGRFDTTLLQNLSLNFGIDPVNGVALLTQGRRTVEPMKVADVSLTIKVEDTRNAGQGSPDGPSSPAYGGTPGGTRPAITLASPQSGVIGTPLSITVTYTGTATVTISLAPGATLPPGLALVAGAITGTPTGTPSQSAIELRASNGYGTSSKIIQLNIAAAAVAPPSPVQVYVRFIRDSASTTVPDAFWCLGYSGMGSVPASEAAFYAATPTSVVTPAGAPSLPTDPGARTGTTGGFAWEISEIAAWDGVDSYTYLYQKAATDTAILDALALGLDPLVAATELYQVKYEVGTDGPSAPSTPSWPGTIVPSSRIEQYYAVKDFNSGDIVVTGLGGDKVFANVAALLAAHKNLSLIWTEIKPLVLLEVYNNFGTPAYLYRQDTSSTLISAKLGATQSPIFHAGNRVGTYDTSLPEPTPDFTPVDLPSPPGLYTGPAPTAETWFYALERLWEGGGYQIIGYRSNTLPALPSLDRVCDVLRKPTSRTAHTETTAGSGWLVEVWALDSGTWKAIWLDAALSASTSLIGKFLADGVSPINHASGAPGRLHTVQTEVF